jgi:hypothetical protein
LSYGNAGGDIESLQLTSFVVARPQTIFGELSKDIIPGKLDAGCIDAASGKLVRGQVAHMVA